MRVFSTLDLLNSHPWTDALFTTYSLSLSFFESVVMDALVRQRVGSVRIFADVSGVRGALSEYGARSAGRLYDVEPVVVKGGCFHPKLTVLASSSEAHVVIGSGNLTFGGWGSNLECVEHLHPGFAAVAIEDVANFLDIFAVTDRVKHGGSSPCAELAARLRNIAAAGARNENIRVLHNLTSSLFSQVEEMALELGGAERLSIISPFYDDSATDVLRSRLGLPEASLHVHAAGTVRGTAGNSWPGSQSPTVKAVTAEWPEEDEPRQLHAKLFEIVCKTGRLLLSGSANATHAAWNADRNVEIAVLRIQRNSKKSWSLHAATIPEPQVLKIDAPVEPERLEGILRATIDAGEVRGSVMTSFPPGEVRILRVSAAGHVDVGMCHVDSEGMFRFPAGTLELQGWSSDRFLLRLLGETGQSASGFVLFPELSEIRTRAGAASSSFFNLLAGTETPKDVAAIMDWFHDHPVEIAPRTLAAHRAAAGAAHGDSLVAVSSLFEEPASPIHSYPISGMSSAAWTRFIDNIIGCFQERRGPLVDSGGEDEPTSETEEAQQQQRLDRAELQRPLAAFDRLFKAMLSAPRSKADLGLTLRLSNYICDRLDIEETLALGYLNRLVDAFGKHQPQERDTPAVTAAVLLWATRLKHGSEYSYARSIRSVLMRIGMPPCGEIPDLQLVYGFARILKSNIDFPALWAQACGMRTPQEEVRVYRTNSYLQLSEAEFPLLSSTATWSALRRARPEDVHFLREYSDVCPTCYTHLPRASAFELKVNGLTMHCGKILMCEGF